MLVDVNLYENTSDYGVQYCYQGRVTINPESVTAIKYRGDFCYLWFDNKPTIVTDNNGAQAIINAANRK